MKEILDAPKPSLLWLSITTSCPPIMLALKYVALPTTLDDSSTSTMLIPWHLNAAVSQRFKEDEEEYVLHVAPGNNNQKSADWQI